MEEHTNECTENNYKKCHEERSKSSGIYMKMDQNLLGNKIKDEKRFLIKTTTVTKNNNYKNGKPSNGSYINVGNRLVKITFTSQKKMQKDLEKKRMLQMIINKKKKKKKEFERRKKIINNLSVILAKEKEMGNSYFLPKRLKRKKKKKSQKYIILEKEIKKCIYNELAESCCIEKKQCLDVIKNRNKWNMKCSTYIFQYFKYENLYYIGIRKRKKIIKYSDCVIYRSNHNDLQKINSINKKGINLKQDDQLYSNQYLDCVKQKKVTKRIYYKADNNKLNTLNLYNIKPNDTPHIIQNSSKNQEYAGGDSNKKENIPLNQDEDNIKAKNTNDNILDNLKESDNTNFQGTNDLNKNIIKENILKNEKILKFIQVSKIEKNTYINDYVDHKITEELNNMVKDFLKKISKSHDKLLLLKKRRRYYLGMKECYKHICINEPKLVLVAPNIEPTLNNVFDDMINKIVCKCKEKNIPLVFALSKNLLGKCIGKCRQSIICIIDNDSYIKECNDIINLANSLKIYK
ncbi:SECIS-binding protein 2, putative [Plasmodium chabaudi chabaudi]|uniref:SECIS-binding protein 2, putative n=1 Tax=Plasmodium chabaudi chabaudi TaxID=31271 RepID=A0A4V0K3Z0_PLACU|nr:SECIS-binding protein 2, putative [Plasmodium chabaudi chabaudi]VTZ67213.1 SECIS-binding protein 2, putative [Plasmodium chabaudi chabaudi]|eukprot:XP_742009.2 SECIS-binding protein 2, putative [Plasmodium chabaudi chabaudi]